MKNKKVLPALITGVVSFQTAFAGSVAFAETPAQNANHVKTAGAVQTKSVDPTNVVYVPDRALAADIRSELGLAA